MVSLKKYDLSGKELEEISVNDEMLNVPLKAQSLKDYVVALRNNKRQWSANTKRRSEVKATKKKPHPQKGTGRARQGAISAPHYKGGGSVFGPKPKFDQHVRINQKEKQAAIQYLLSEKIKGGNLHILQLGEMKEPKTKLASDFINKIGLTNKRILMVGDSSSDNKNSTAAFVMSLRNIPKTAFAPTSSISGADLMLGDELIVMDTVFEELMTFLRRDA